MFDNSHAEQLSCQNNIVIPSMMWADAELPLPSAVRNVMSIQQVFLKIFCFFPFFMLSNCCNFHFDFSLRSREITIGTHTNCLMISVICIWKSCKSKECIPRSDHLEYQKKVRINDESVLLQQQANKFLVIIRNRLLQGRFFCKYFLWESFWNCDTNNSTLHFCTFHLVHDLIISELLAVDPLIYLVERL